MRIRLYAIKKEVIFHQLQKKHCLKNIIKTDMSQLTIHHTNTIRTAPINSRLIVVVRSPAPLGWVEMAVGLPEGPSYPGHSPFIFSLCCSLKDRTSAPHSFFKICRLFSLFLFSCPSLSLLRLLILLLLLMSGNVHPNPGPVFPCSVCAGNMT